MAHIANPIKSYNYVVEVDGLDTYLVQSITLPEREVEKVEHGEGQSTIKTAGKFIIGDITMSKLIPTEMADSWATEWLDASYGTLANVYKKTLVVKVLHPDSTTIARSYICRGCFPSKVSLSEFSSTTSENIIETVVFSVDSIEQL